MVKITATTEPVEIRGCTRKISQKGTEYLQISVDTDSNMSGGTAEFADYDLSREHLYRKGERGVLTLEIETGRYKNIAVSGFETYIR